MKKFITFATILISVSLHGQGLVGNFFKYSTLYTSAMASSPMQAQTEYFVTQSGDLVDVTVHNPYDYRTTIGLRRVARFDYENRQNRFYDGHNQSTTALSATVGAVTGFEYLAQYDKGRQQGNDYISQRYFLRYLGKYWLVKGEYYQQGLVNLDYAQVEARLKLPLGKINLSAGTALRQHNAYGYNPINEYLKNKAWWDLAYEYGYEDSPYGIDHDLDGEIDTYDWWWYYDGEQVADTDEDFRKYIYGNIVNDYNKTALDSVGLLGSMSVIVGLDFYHYSEDFWMHAWGNVLPWHKHILGPHEYSYKNFLEHQCGPECMENMHRGVQWIDYSLGAVMGYKAGVHWGVFAEAEYMRYWDRNVYLVTAGINYQFR